jgi:two-component system, OmpR family, sensor kinase
MRIRTHILIFQTIVALSVATLAVVAYVNVQSARYTLDRVRWANQELQAMTQLAVSANRYSEQIAEVLLIGEPELPDFESARADVRKTFLRLRKLIHEEIAFLSDQLEQQQERQELDRLDHMEAVFDEIELAAERVLGLSRAGQQQEAIALFRTDIENRLDAEFEKMIADAVASERDEVLHAEADADRRSLRLMTATVIISAVLMALTLGAGFFFARSLSRPMSVLAEGALAIGRGELNHRIGFEGDNEFGLLAQRFNQMASDLSRQREDLLAASHDLEIQVEQRTQELAETNARLTNLDALRARFLTDASHELRTPLTVLRGEAEVALRGTTKPEEHYRPALQRIIEQAIDMGRLVDDLLFLARSEAGEIRFERREIELGSIVAETVREAVILGRERDVMVTLHETDRAIHLLVDPHRLRQALLIILDNAIRYSCPGGEVRIRIDVHDSREAEVTVQDDGPGISMDDLPHVFQRFYRGQNARMQAPGGSGLGLPIALWIVEKHGGTIRPSSPPGGGTIMRISLPVVTAV